jgi:hypothetical protein
MQEYLALNSSVMVITGRSHALGLTKSDLLATEPPEKGPMRAKLAVIAFGAFVLIPTIKAWPRWDERFAQIEQSIRDWYKAQEMNPATWERLGSPSWKSCCEKGDVFHTQFRVINNGTKYGEDTWWYEKDGKWKQVPPDTIHWGQHAPNGQPTLFIYQNTGQELCFYPGRDGQ